MLLCPAIIADSQDNGMVKPMNIRMIIFCKWEYARVSVQTAAVARNRISDRLTLNEKELT